MNIITKTFIPLYKKYNQNRYLRYLISGGIIFGINISAVWFLIEIAGLKDGTLERNLSHLIGVEISVITGFFLHNYITWQSGGSSILKKLFEFHVVTGFTILLRQLIFYFLDDMGLHWFVSTILPILLAIIINFIGYDKLVFKRKPSS